MPKITEEDVTAVRARLRVGNARMRYGKAEQIIEEFTERLARNNERLEAIIQTLVEQQEEVFLSFRSGKMSLEQARTHLRWKFLFLVALFESAESRKIIEEQGDAEFTPIAELNAMVDEARTDMLRARWKRTPNKK